MLAPMPTPRTPARSRRPSSAEVEPLLELTQVLVAVAVRSVEAAAAPLTLPQFRALRVLDRTGPCNGGGLAEHLGTHASTVTRICDRLVALGHITREPRADNRREVELAVTPSGHALAQAVLVQRAEELKDMLGALSPEVRQCLADALPPLLDAAQDQHGELPRGWAHEGVTFALRKGRARAEHAQPDEEDPC